MLQGIVFAILFASLRSWATTLLGIHRRDLLNGELDCLIGSSFSDGENCSPADVSDPFFADSMGHFPPGDSDLVHSMSPPQARIARIIKR
jgi:hypothetical protein